jgi:hypothetical protein
MVTNFFTTSPLNADFAKIRQFQPYKTTLFQIATGTLAMDQANGPQHEVAIISHRARILAEIWRIYGR